jgi:hypothetical protein
MTDDTDSELEANFVTAVIVGLIGLVAALLIGFLAAATPDIAKAVGWPLTSLLWLMLLICVRGSDIDRRPLRPRAGRRGRAAGFHRAAAI